jgi:hypothetical protein
MISERKLHQLVYGNGHSISTGYYFCTHFLASLFIYCLFNALPTSKQKVQTASALGYYVRRDRSDQLDKKTWI